MDRHDKKHQPVARRAVTLIEVLIAIAIVAMLVALGVGAIQKVRAAAANAKCTNQLKQIGLACHSVHTQHKRMPPAFGFFPGNDIFSGTNGLGNVFFHLLPYLDQGTLYQRSRHQVPATGRDTRPQDFFFYTHNDVHQSQLAIFNCPSDPTLKPGVDTTRYAQSSYAANYLVFGRVHDDDFANFNAQGNPRLGVSFPDGASQTILFAEKYASAWISAEANDGKMYKGGCHWAYFQADCNNPFFAFVERPQGAIVPQTDPNAVGPNNNPADPRNGRFQIQPNAAGGCNPCLPATGHAAMNVCMADGSVRALAGSMDRQTWWALVTPAGGDVANPD